MVIDDNIGQVFNGDNNVKCKKLILRNLIARYRRTPPEDVHSEEFSFEAMHI